MKTVIVVNGKPRAGKDTSIEFMKQACAREELETHEFSSIDPVRSALHSLGIDTTAKTENDRAALSEIGDTLERYYSFRTEKCTVQINVAFAAGVDVFFLHMREPALIEKLAAMTPWPVRKVYIDADRAENVTSNASDTGTWRERFYDHVIRNNGTLDDLRQECSKFLLEIGVLAYRGLLQ
ncbi:hypothetical protein [Sinorhizobium meliloti]|uniref:hypothetical protein n=1 Tax=Rhizobium meliloti TaxID=382 RepID=UPI0001E4AB58|nr:hypothetical protein [Sinorhizobium meliloti]AEG53141.1 hypothetical protein Sinme_1394 [Sinorhizobium meliloti AK83]MDE4591144.1 hypothetical protein [Sinorhizobium meliloti]SEI55946.1 hypothetical protein SAMN04244575_01042 [Sinorhizobium meliloti]